MKNSVTSQQLLTSGLLEAYLLGLTTEADRSDIQELMAQNPALFCQLDALDADIEAHFREVAVPPPPAIRDLIELRTTEPQLPQRTNDTDFNQHTTYREQAHKTNYVDVEVDDTHIRVHKNWRPAFIAIFILSKIFLIAALYFYFKADSQAKEIERLKIEMGQPVRK